MISEEIKVGDCFKYQHRSSGTLHWFIVLENGSLWCKARRVNDKGTAIARLDSKDFTSDAWIVTRITPTEFKEQMESAFAAIKNEVEECLK